jgi:hypothetical protein
MADLDTHRRNSIYNHPSSERHRDERAATHRGVAADPIAALRVEHCDQTTELQRKHKAQMMDLNTKHQRARAADPMLSAGKRPSPEYVMKENAERQRLADRHTGDRGKLSDRQHHEMQTALTHNKAHAR